MNELESREEELKAKYGDAKVAVVPSAFIEQSRIKIGWTDVGKGIFNDGAVCGKLHHVINNRMTLMLRHKAEIDTTFKQIIPYVVVINDDSGKIFVTRRLAGDERLRNQLSIGIGGHIESGESLMEGMHRELEEEIGLAPDDVGSCQIRGYIYDNTTEVNSVHLGLVYELRTSKEDIRCQESDTLMGAWASVEELMKYYQGGVFESWSEIAFKEIILRGGKS